MKLGQWIKYAYSYLSPFPRQLLYYIVTTINMMIQMFLTLWQVLRDANQEVPAAMLDFDLNIKRKEHKLYGSFGPRGDAGQPMKKATKIVFDNDE